MSPPPLRTIPSSLLTIVRMSRRFPAGASATAADVPVDVAFVQDGLWSADFVAVCRVKGRDLGLTGDDAGELSVYVHFGAFCRIPDAFTPEQKAGRKTEKMLKSLDADPLTGGD